VPRRQDVSGQAVPVAENGDGTNTRSAVFRAVAFDLRNVVSGSGERRVQQGRLGFASPVLHHARALSSLAFELI